MMLRTSSNSINPTSKMLGLTLRKNLGLIILTVAVALLICPGYMTISLESIIYATDFIFPMSEWIDGITIFASFLGLVVTFIYNIVNLSYMFSKSSSDVFHSVPLTRGELLFSRAVSGLISTLIPIAVLFISLTVLSAIYYCFSLYIGTILLCFAFVVVSTLVFWSMSIMFSVCAGAVFDYILSYVGANLGLLVIAVIVNQLLDNYLLGYTAGYRESYPIYKFFSPIYYCINSITDFLYDNMDTTSIILFFVVAVILTVVFYTATYLLYKKRKAEKAGNAYAYRFIYLVCGFIAAFCGAYGVGIIFSLGDINTITYWVFAPIGAILTAIAYGAITNRGFKQFKRSILLGTASVAIMGLITLLMILDPIGFSKRLPNENNIESVMVNIGDKAPMIIYYTDNKLPLELHKRIVKENLALSGENYGEGYSTVYLEYTLKNGKSLKRHFTVLEEDIEEETLRNYVSDEHFDMYYDMFVEAKPMDLNLSYTDREYHYEVEITENQLKELFEIYKAEAKTAGNVLENVDVYTRNFFVSWYHGPSHQYRSTTSIYLNRKCVKTRKYIESLIADSKTEAIK